MIKTHFITKKEVAHLTGLSTKTISRKCLSLGIKGKKRLSPQNMKMIRETFFDWEEDLDLGGFKRIA